MKKIQGFTIIELLVYIALTSILISLMSQIFLATLGVRLESQSTTNVQQDGRYIMSRLSYDVRRATSIEVPLSGQTSSSLSLRIFENGAYQTYTYAVSNTDLMLSSGSDTDPLTSSGTTVESLSFRRVSETVEITLTLVGSEEVSSGQQTITLQTSVGIR
ncbi:MAG TPA: prepilin-type N-terminal cleavage/methylation domain-containing protein [Patescibacteria group bacterium]|nr:prepilin-type N-terminal cleavage/methylation domain-containing protein [Patescibacteria group bacterium]